MPGQEHRPAGQREGVDLLLVHHVEGVGELRVLELGRNRGDEPRTDVLDVLIDALVVQYRQFLLGLRSGLATQLHVLGGRVLRVRRFDPGLRRNRHQSGEQRAGDEGGVSMSGQWCAHGGHPVQMKNQARAVSVMAAVASLQS
jgi:hypothetical protein